LVDEFADDHNITSSIQIDKIHKKLKRRVQKTELVEIEEELENHTRDFEPAKSYNLNIVNLK